MGVAREWADPARRLLRTRYAVRISRRSQQRRTSGGAPNLRCEWCERANRRLGSHVRAGRMPLCAVARSPSPRSGLDRVRLAGRALSAPAMHFARAPIWCWDCVRTNRLACVLTVAPAAVHFASQRSGALRSRAHTCSDALREQDRALRAVRSAGDGWIPSRASRGAHRGHTDPALRRVQMRVYFRCRVRACSDAANAGGGLSSPACLSSHVCAGSAALWWRTPRPSCWAWVSTLC